MGRSAQIRTNSTDGGLRWLLWGRERPQGAAMTVKNGVGKSSCTTYDDKDLPPMGAGTSIWEMSAYRSSSDSLLHRWLLGIRVDDIPRSSHRGQGAATRISTAFGTMPVFRQLSFLFFVRIALLALSRIVVARIYFSLAYSDYRNGTLIYNACKYKRAAESIFFDESIWNEARKKGDAASRELIDRSVERSDVTVFLVGEKTYVNK